MEVDTPPFPGLGPNRGHPTGSFTTSRYIFISSRVAQLSQGPRQSHQSEPIPHLQTPLTVVSSRQFLSNSPHVADELPSHQVEASPAASQLTSPNAGPSAPQPRAEPPPWITHGRLMGVADRAKMTHAWRCCYSLQRVSGRSQSIGHIYHSNGLWPS